MTYLLKFLHLLLALGLLGTSLYCIIAAIRNKPRTRAPQFLLLFSVFALITGSLLVIPKHYSFTTPWIQAAYLFITLFMLSVATLFYLKKKHGLKHRGLLLLAYLFLTTLLVVIIHDAVTKSTFLF